MPSSLTNLINQARTWWEVSNTPTRMMAVGMAVGVILALALAITLASTPDYQDLFANLSPTDAAAITQKLDDMHEHYEIVDESTIRVPAADKDRLRMEMIRNGLPNKPASVLGTEWLDKVNPGTTSEVQDQYILLAEEGELTQTIEHIDNVASASVKLAKGNDSPFLGDTTPPSASVVISMKPGSSMSSDVAANIAALLATSVTGLTAKNVTVLDSSGDSLWDGGSDNPTGGGTGGTTAQDQQFAAQKQKEYQSDLDLAFGPGKTRVMVEAELNHDKIHSIQTVYLKGAVLSDQTTEEKYSGGVTPPVGGVSGVSDNSAPKYATATASGKDGTYDNQSDTTSYAPNKTQTETDAGAGTIRKMSVAVFVDASLPADEVDKIRTSLSTLVQVVPNDTSRQVTVQQIAFVKPVTNDKQFSQFIAQQEMETIAKSAVIIFIVLAILFIFLKASGATRRLPVEERALSLSGGESRGMLSEIESHEQLLGDGSPVRIEDMLAEMPEVRPRKRTRIPEIEEQLDVKLESVRDMVTHHPQSVALLLKGWMSQDSAE